MVIVATLYVILIWVIFGKLKLLPWNRMWKSIIAVVGLLLLLVVLGLLNFFTPSGSFSVVARVTEITPNISGHISRVLVRPNEPIAKGAPLFEIEKAPFEFEVDRLRAAVRPFDSRISHAEGGGLSDSSRLWRLIRRELDRAAASENQLGVR